MELLIPGLILVALMVYASTRIKKTAALAFEAETINTDGFALEKPEGFLHVLNGDPELEFEAYSRDFGGEGAENIKQARAEVRRFENSELDASLMRIRESANVLSTVSEVIDEKKYILLEAEASNNGIEMMEFYKIADAGTDVRVLKISALKETNPEIERKIETLLASFVVK